MGKTKLSRYCCHGEALNGIIYHSTKEFAVAIYELFKR
jgi:hypothetical protein